ncbi:MULTISPECIES: hypothetical protein [Pseudoalteromonas]|uniref:Uncharacterized protein n=1 Tax=Pseudoalteromonas amylolytica TaxID=1859457 RepID=A0A1S1MXL0_9GAMM|nr:MULTISPECIES: hypothetical protein [Pseudoalteromonas]OHU89200.1 hypothetical protein BFC16_06065 [Pseudoalteromonas sp. JW3]OHU92100.1 hypothetical protein BET10_07170 [Pseudoalteromonas amylolytica]
MKNDRVETIHHQALELGSIGEYVEGDSFTQIIEFDDGITITAAVYDSTEIHIRTSKGDLVFHATEFYDCCLAIHIYEAGDWEASLEREFNFLTQKYQRP